MSVEQIVEVSELKINLSERDPELALKNKIKIDSFRNNEEDCFIDECIDRVNMFTHDNTLAASMFFEKNLLINE
jgi:hypothetical protein